MNHELMTGDDGVTRCWWPGDRADIGKIAFQATPILDDRTLYLCSPAGRIFALDAESGEQRWVFDARVTFDGGWNKICRGVALWRAARPGCERGARPLACAAVPALCLLAALRA